MSTKTLDLGCGAKPRNPFNADEVYGIDVREDLDNRVKQADLAIEPIPFPDAFFEYVSAYDFIEHIPRIVYAPHRRNSFIELMNEIYRVLKPNGVFLSSTPCYPHPSAFVDPTHVNFITEGTFPLYFDKVNCWARSYGFKGAFDVSQAKNGSHLLAKLTKN
jgi:SAM-dependent methyltransferase